MVPTRQPFAEAANRVDPFWRLDRYLPETIRAIIEEQYLVAIDAQARVERVIHDPVFYQDPNHYPPFFADHGTVHHRDVAHQVLQVLDTVHGLLIPAREPGRLSSMKGYGVILAYLHDLGMSDFSPLGRAIHPHAAAQEVFEPEFDGILELIWQEKKKLGKGSLTFADGHFYLRSEKGGGTIALIEATTEGYKEKSRFDQPDRSKKNSWPHPVICGGKLYIRDQDILLCYDVKAR